VIALAKLSENDQLILKLGNEREQEGRTWKQVARVYNEATGTTLNAQALRSKYRGLTGEKRRWHNKQGVKQELEVVIPESQEPIISDEELEAYLNALEVCQSFEKDVRGFEDGEMTDLHYTKNVSKSLVIDIKESGWFAVVYYSDWHVGAIDTKHRQIYHECKIIEATDGMYVGFQGDLGDAGSISKHQGIKHEQMSSPAAQRKICLKFAQILSPKLLFMILGCHDYWAKDAADYDFVAEAARIGKCKHLGGGGRYWLRTKEGVIYNGVAFHKVTGYSQYNDCHPCVRRSLFHEQDADIITVAHTHIIATAKQILGERTRFMARTAARKEFDGYALKLAPDDKRKDMDVPVLLLHGTTKQGEWVHGIEKAAELLTALRTTI